MISSFHSFFVFCFSLLFLNNRTWLFSCSSITWCLYLSLSLSFSMWWVCVCVVCYFVSGLFSDNVSSIFSIDSIYILCVVRFGSFVQRFFFFEKTDEIILERCSYWKRLADCWFKDVVLMEEISILEFGNDVDRSNFNGKKRFPDDLLENV